jgi:hypothetical protein
MESQVADEAKCDLLRTSAALTPEERLDAFLAHCRLVAELAAAGERLRDLPSPEVP